MNLRYLFPLLILSLSYSSVFAHEGHTEEKIKFIQNKGQWEGNVRYKARIGGGSVWLENNMFTFDFQNQEDLEKFHLLHHGKLDRSQFTGVRSHAYQLRFVGANTATAISASARDQQVNNYFIGSDPTKWAAGVPLFAEVMYQNIFQGIDMRVGTHEGYFKYDFVVRTGADASLVKWNYEGVEAELTGNEIHISTNAGEVIERVPEVYQVIKGVKKIVACNLVFTNGNFSFEFPDGYNKKYDLIIDPTLIFSTFTGSTTDNWGYTATYDNAGSLYAGGIVFDNGYPTSAGAYDNTFANGAGTIIDVAITKYTPTGNNIVYSTYLGGSGSDAPHSLFVDSGGNLVVFGTTSSTNFPTTAGCYDNSFNGGVTTMIDAYVDYTGGSDLYLTKFNATGSALIGSTYVGGSGNDGLNDATTLFYNYGDTNRGEVIVDNNDNIYVATCSQSNNFPTTAGSLSQTYQGGQDGVAFRMSPGLNALTWSTYVGGTNGDAAYAIKTGTNGTTYIGGGTVSSNFPVTAGTIHTTNQGGSSDGYVIAVNSNTGAQIAGTYVGTNAYDQAYFLEIDDNNKVYITGQTLGAYPVTNANYSVSSGSQFIHKMNSALTLTDYSTVFGSGSGSGIDISLTAFLVDDCENVYVSGWGGGTNAGYGNGSTTGLPVTSDAYDATTDGSDFYFFVMERGADSQLYGSFFGGSSQEHVDGGTSRFDKNGTIYQAVCAACGGGNTFPTTPGSWSTNNGSSNCNLGSIKMEFVYTGIVADAQASPNIIACDPPFTVNFTGASAAVDHVWDFGDGTGTSTQANPSYTYTDTGSFTITYIAIDSSTCNIADTTTLSVIIMQSETFAADFNILPFDPCQGDTLVVDLAFTGSGADSLIWNFGDGTFIYNDTSVTHSYLNQGTYILSLTAFDLQCNRTQTFSDTVSYISNILFANANASPNVIACDPPYTVNFTGSAAQDYYWYFGIPGATSTQANPSYTFTDTGYYNIMFIAIDSTTCNIADTAYTSVTILQSEEFSASLSSVPPQPCRDTVLVALQFTGTGADSLIWNMGDGTIFTDDTTVNYFYTTPGSYTISLTAYDLTCNEVQTISQTIVVNGNVIQGNVKVPNVFSPNSDPVNREFVIFYDNFPGVDALADMEVYHVEVFDRWGVKMFESDASTQKWDGTHKGKDAPEGVYFYILTYQRKCWDSSPTTTNGHVTIER